MGWVSYLEDIIESLTKELQEAKNVIDTNIVSVEHNQKLFNALIAEADRIHKALTALIELATDPDADLAAENIELKRKIKSKESYNRIWEKTNEELKNKLDKLGDEYEKLKEKYNNIYHENKKLKEKLNCAFEENPEKLYDIYSSPNQIKKLKPDS